MDSQMVLDQGVLVLGATDTKLGPSVFIWNNEDKSEGVM